MQPLFRSGYDEPVILLAAVITLSIFVVDLLLPAGISVSVLYVIVVLLGLGIRYRFYPYIAGGVTTLLTITGLFLSPSLPGELFFVWSEYFNRLLFVMGIWLSVFVITKFKLSELQVKKQEEQLDAQFHFSNEGIMISDRKGNIVMSNPSAERMFSYDKGDLTGRKIEELVPKRLREKHVDHRQSYFQNPHSRSMGEGMDLFGKRKDGSEFPVEISLSYYESRHSGMMAIAFISDITERKAHEEAISQANNSLKEYSEKLEASYKEQTQQIEQIHRLNRDLEERVRDRTQKLETAIEELKQSKEELSKSLAKEKEVNELKSRFVSMASHEFRTPLSTILSSVSLINRYSDAEKAKREKHIERIKSTVRNMTAILNDFLSLGKLEEGKVILQPEEVAIETFFSEVTEEMQALAEKGRTIQYEHEGKNAILMVDRRMLQNILHNLLSNAIKYSHPNGKIVLQTALDGDTFTITVEDEGIGIPEDEQRYMFTRFFRGRNVANTQGTGLGLNIVQKYVEMMNGSITFTSMPGKGSTFVVTFHEVEVMSNS